jgi:hypothetical protein
VTAEIRAAVRRALENRLDYERPSLSASRLQSEAAALTAKLAEAEQKLERFAAVSSERNHGASGMCCQLRLHEKGRADDLESRLAEAEKERDAWKRQ